MSETNTLQVTISGAQLRLLQLFHDKYDREHSLTYTFEECLVAGIQAKQRSKDYSVETQNRKKFEKEIASNPSAILNPAEMLRLMKKYGIGSSNTKLEEQVMEAAQKLQDEAEEKATAPTETKAA